MLEPDARKPACPVLRGRGASNGLPLPDPAMVEKLGKLPLLYQPGTPIVPGTSDDMP